MTSSFAGRILVVDDHDLNLKLLQRVLELDGHRVTAVSTLSAAERAIALEIPELVVLDLNLPDGDGLDFVREAKKVQPLKAIAMTGRDSEQERMAGLKAGFDCYLTKPIDFRELQKALRN